MTRGRIEKLKRCLNSIYSNAKYPDSIETVIRIDDDDSETLTLFKSGYFKAKNIIVYSGPRIGFDNFRTIFKQIYPTLRGEIIIPMADDVVIVFNNFDEFYYNNFKDKAVVFGKNSRNGFTRKLAEKDENVRSFMGMDKGKTPADTKIWLYARRNGFCELTHPTFAHLRPHVPDKTYEEGSQGGWKLKDKSILRNLEFKRVYG